MIYSKSQSNKQYSSDCSKSTCKIQTCNSPTLTTIKWVQLHLINLNVKIEYIPQVLSTIQYNLKIFTQLKFNHISFTLP